MLKVKRLKQNKELQESYKIKFLREKDDAGLEPITFKSAVKMWGNGTAAYYEHAAPRMVATTSGPKSKLRSL